MGNLPPNTPNFVIPAPSFVIPAQAGIQGGRAMTFVTLDPRLRGDDGMEKQGCSDE